MQIFFLCPCVQFLAHPSKWWDFLQFTFHSVWIEYCWKKWAHSLMVFAKFCCSVYHRVQYCFEFSSLSVHTNCLSYAINSIETFSQWKINHIRASTLISFTGFAEQTPYYPNIRWFCVFSSFLIRFFWHYYLLIRTILTKQNSMLKMLFDFFLRLRIL